MSLTFRELTEEECRNARDMIASDSKRSAAEQYVLGVLEEAKQKFLASGGIVKHCQAFQLSDPDSYKRQTLSKAQERLKRNLKISLALGKSNERPQNDN